MVVKKMKTSKKDNVIQNKLENLDWGTPPKSVIAQAKELAYAKKPPRVAWLKFAASAAPTVPYDKTLKTFSVESFYYDYESASKTAKDHGVLFFSQNALSSVEMMDYDKNGQILTYAVTSGGDIIVVTAKLGEADADLFSALSTPLNIRGVRINYTQQNDGGGTLFTATFTYRQADYTVTVKTGAPSPEAFRRFVGYLEALLD